MPTSSPRRSVRFSRVLSLAAGAALMASGALMGTATAADDMRPEAEQHPAVIMDRPLDAPCYEGWICIWDQPHGWPGNRVDYTQCTDGAYDVRDAGLERVRSFINNQTSGTVAEFYGQDENGEWHAQYQSTAFEFWDDDRGHQNTYRVDPC